MYWWLFIARHNQGQSSPTSGWADRYRIAANVHRYCALFCERSLHLGCKPLCYYIRPKIVPGGAGLAYIQRGAQLDRAKRLEIHTNPQRKSITNQEPDWPGARFTVRREIINVIDPSAWRLPLFLSQWGRISQGPSLKHPPLSAFFYI